MKQLFTEIEQQLNQNKDVVLVTIIASSGSTPRGTGARMAVTDKGRLCGTIGGGTVEYKSIQIAMETLKNKSSILHSFCLMRNEVEDLGMICGGSVTVYFRYISYTDSGFSDFMNHLRYLYEHKETCWLLTDLSEESRGNMGLYGVKSGLLGLDNVQRDIIQAPSRRTQKIQIGEKVFYAEELIHAGKVYIFGGGHVAQELVPMLTHVGFRCVVADDRPDFASKDLFPDAEQVILIDFKNIEKEIQLTEDDAVCVMTRGHAYDTTVQLQVLKTPVFYIGVIGSVHKIASVTKIMRENGYSEKKIAGIHTPIGMAIRAETPAEIAVSITGELILERAKRFDNEKAFIT